MLFALFVFACAVSLEGCSLNTSAPALPESPLERLYCADLAKLRPDYACGDITLPTKDWPDKTIVCVDGLNRCASLGDLRDWLLRYQSRLGV